MIPQFAQYNAYGASAVQRPFLMNATYDITQSNEANTLDNVASEFYYLYGTDLTFLPREVNKEETTFGEYLSAVFNQGFPIRMFVEEVEAWSGGGDMYSKFGLQVTDEVTCYLNKTSFKNATMSNSAPSGLYPKQGDLLYLHKSQKLFQISHIEDEIQPAFYLLGNRAGYKFQCKLFMYNDEVISQSPSAGIPAAIQALDSLLNDLEGNQVLLPEKDFNHNNKPIQTSSVPIIDTTEDDPLV